MSMSMPLIGRRAANRAPATIIQSHFGYMRLVAPRGKGKSSHIPHADMLSLPFDINLVVHLQSSRFCESTFAGDTCGGKLLHRCIV
jgi:hypothetical protein